MDNQEPMTQPVAPQTQTKTSGGGGDVVFKVVVGIVLGLTVLAVIFVWVRISRITKSYENFTGDKATELMTNIANFNTRADQVEARIEELKTSITTLQTTAEDNRTRIDDLNAQADENKTAIDEVKAEVDALK